MGKLIKTYGFWLILAQSFVLICAAQPDLPANSSGDIQFYVDESSFYNQSLVYNEFYVMVYTDQLKLTPKNNSVYAELNFRITLKDVNRETIKQDEWETTVQVGTDSELIETSVVYDLWYTNLEAGNYYLELEVKDKISGKTGIARKEIISRVNSDQNIFLSDIQFAADIYASTGDQEIFDKGNVTVIPNPSRRYGLLNPILYTYFEIYSNPESLNKDLKIIYEILTLEGTSLRSFEGKTVTLKGATVGIPNAFNVSAVASGVYTLVVKALEGDNVVSETRRNLEVIQVDYFEQEEVLSDQEAEMFGEIIRLISTNKNYELYQSLNKTGKAKYLIEFWRQNDPTPFTNENELLDRITERYQYANKHFSWGGIDGWKTDRGKILIKYGMPDNIQRFASETSTAPYEIWEYQSRRNYQFVFGDLRSDGRYTLLHSTKEDEISNPYWKEELNKM